MGNRTAHRLTDRQLGLMRLIESGDEIGKGDRELCRLMGMNARRPGALSRVYNVLRQHRLIAYEDGHWQVTAKGHEALGKAASGG